MKILRVWLEAPEVWDVVTYMADLEKQLSESIVENEVRKREEAERKAQERREKKKRAQLEKDVAKREGKGSASVETATGDGDVSSKSKMKKKKKKQKTEVEVIVDTSGDTRIDVKKGEEKEEPTQPVPKEREDCKETEESRQSDENKEIEKSKETVEVALETLSSQCETDTIDSPAVLDEDECIAPTARLFKDWRPPSPEHQTTIDEPPFWKKKDEFGRPQFPFLGFHQDPDELGVKTPDTSTDTDSSSPGSTELPKVLLNDRATKTSDATYKEGMKLLDEQEAQERLLESSKFFLEEMEIAGFPWAEDLGGVAGRDDDMFDEEFFKHEREPVKAREQSSIDFREDYMSEMMLYNQETDSKKLISTDSIDDQPTVTSEYGTGMMPDLIAGETRRSDFLETCVDTPLLSAVAAADMTELDELDLSGFKVVKSELAPKESKDTDDDREVDVQEVVIEVQKEGDNSYAVFSRDNPKGVPRLSGRSSSKQYQNTFTAPKGSKVHFSHELVEDSGSSSPQYNFEFCVEMPAELLSGNSLDKGLDGQDSKANVTSSITNMVRLATELTQGDSQGVRAMLLGSEESGSSETDGKAHSQAFVDKLVSTLVESVTSLRDAKKDSKKSEVDEANPLKPTDAMKECGDAGKVAVKGEAAKSEDPGKVAVKGEAAKSEDPGKVPVKGESAKSDAAVKTSGNVGKQPDLPVKTSRSVVKSAGKSASQPVGAVSKRKQIQLAQPVTAKPVVLNEFSGGAGWVRSFCKGEVLSKFDGHFRQSIFLRNVTPEQLLAKTTTRPKDVPRREFPSLEEGSISDPSMVEFMKKTTGGIFFVTRLGTYSLLKHTKWAAFYGAYICSHTCRCEEKLWKKHPEGWKAADLRLRKSSEPTQPVTNAYFSTVYTMYNHVNIPILYCYLDWNMQMLSNIQLPRDAEMVCAIRYVFVSPRGNDHILDFISTFLDVTEGKILHTLLFPTFEISLERGGTIKQIPVDRVDRPAIVSAYTVIKPSGDSQFLEKLQEQIPEMAIAPNRSIGVMELAPFKMGKNPLPNSAVIMKSPAGRQILSEFLKACMKEKQERARQIAAGLDPDAFYDNLPFEDPFEAKPVAKAEKTATKRKGKGKGKGKRRQEVEEPSEQLRTCACCGKEETTPKVFKKCKLYVTLNFIG